MGRIKRVVDACHFENERGEEVERCESCNQWKPAKVFMEDGVFCVRCVKELETELKSAEKRRGKNK
jgi:hypothetical protein